MDDAQPCSKLKRGLDENAASAFVCVFSPSSVPVFSSNTQTRTSADPSQDLCARSSGRKGLTMCFDKKSLPPTIAHEPV